VQRGRGRESAEERSGEASGRGKSSCGLSRLRLNEGGERALGGSLEGRWVGGRCCEPRRAACCAMLSERVHMLFA